MPKRFILTGAPGAGKTTIIGELARRGFTIVPEAATDFIASEQARGIEEPWRDSGFASAVARLQTERVAANSAAVQFHDRSVFCTLALARFLGQPVPASMARALEAATELFERMVFFPRLLGFITPTPARRISLEEARRFEAVHEQVYAQAGFELVFIEPGDVQTRTEAILERASAYWQS